MELISKFTFVDTITNSELIRHDTNQSLQLRWKLKCWRIHGHLKTRHAENHIAMILEDNPWLKDMTDYFVRFYETDNTVNL